MLTRNLNQDTISGNFDIFLEQLAECFRLHSRLEIQHETDVLIAANDTLKIALIKLQMIHNTKLSKSEQIMVHAATGSSFKQLVSDMRTEGAAKSAIWKRKTKAAKLNQKFDFSWQGVRQSVELPVCDS